MFGIYRFSMTARPLVARQQVPSSSVFLQQTAEFSKYISKARAKRLPLTTKKAGKGYYKGNGSRKEGYITSKGKFIRVPDMVTELVTPDFSQFKLKPYVAVEARRNKATRKHVYILKHVVARFKSRITPSLLTRARCCNQSIDI
eukprot:gene16496-19507_t